MSQHHDVAIIGSGFAGLAMAYQLKASGREDFVVFEKEAGVGGTWRVNQYPGCACDVQSHLYSFSFAPNPDWSRMFAPQPEIREYLENCAEHFGLMPHIRLKTALAQARWDEDAQHWQIRTTDGEEHTARVLVSAMGGLSRPALPNIPGLDGFSGKVFHSQQWDHDYDLNGKRVAVIGTGASAIQFVPQIQKQVARLDLYQRTPPWIIPKPDRAISLTEKWLFRHIPAAQKAFRRKIYLELESRVMGFVFDPRLMALPKRWALKHIRKQIQNPDLRRKVTPDYTIGCKRILMSNDYYPALDQANVDVITSGVAEIRSHALVASDGTEREVDAIILGTGFAATDPVPRGLIFGRDGADITNSWQDGPQAYKGTTVAGFPNLFILSGPNTGLGHSSVIYMIESQVNYVMDALRQMDARSAASVCVRDEAQQAYCEALDAKLDGSVWNAGGCSSWYRHPVSNRNTSLWPGFTFAFRRETRRFDAAAYEWQAAG